MLVGKMWVLLSARAKQLRLSHRIFINMQYNQPRPFSRHVHRCTLMHPLLQVLQDLKPGRVILSNSLPGQTNQVQVDYHLFYLDYKRKNMNHEFRSKIMKAWGNIFRWSTQTQIFATINTFKDSQWGYKVYKIIFNMVYEFFGSSGFSCIFQ